MDLQGFCDTKLWDSNLTWYTSNPGFTACFSNTVLVWIPVAFIWIFTPFEIMNFRDSKQRDIPFNKLNISKMIFSLLLVLISALNIWHCIFSRNYYHDELSSYVVKAVNYVLILMLIVFSRIYGARSSAIQFTFWVLASVAESLRFISLVKGPFLENSINDVTKFVLNACEFFCVVAMFALSFISDKKPRYHVEREGHFPPHRHSPEADASVFSKLVYHWMNGVISQFLNNRLKDSEISNWWTSQSTQSELSSGKQTVNSETDLTTLLQMFLKEQKCYYFWGLFIQVICVSVNNFQVFIVYLMIDFMENHDPLWKGIAYSFLYFLMEFSQDIGYEIYSRRMLNVKIHLKTTLITALYKKALRISFTAKCKCSTGELLNAISVDVQRVTNAFAQLDFLVSLPVQVSLVFYLSYQFLGISGLCGMTFIFAGIVAIFMLMKLKKKLEVRLTNVTNKRVKKMSEILNGIKVLKLYGWNTSFQKQIHQIKSKENSILRKLAIINSVSTTIWLGLTFPGMLLSLLLYMKIENIGIIAAKTMFVAYRIFSQTRIIFRQLPAALNSFTLAKVSLERIISILKTEELEYYVSNIPGNSTDEVISLCEASFFWKKDVPIIEDINFAIPKGKLVAVIGEVGSGKSSLLSAILGNIEKLKGTVTVQGSIAYVPQLPWILNDSLKRNILLDDTFDQLYYQKVIDGCGLSRDLKILPANDETEIGEKGINLSGGQKQRVSLARAVYLDAEIYLLDDPLSAVDSHVGKHIFEHIIGPEGMLQYKTRILVTHNIGFLSAVDDIYFVKNGKIIEKGSCNELLARNGPFKDFFLAHNILKDETTFKTVKIPSTARLSKRSSSTKVESNNAHEKRICQEDKTNLIKAEHVFYGEVTWNVYRKLAREFGYFWLAVMTIFQIGSFVFLVALTYWFTRWCKDSVRISSFDIVVTVLLVIGQFVTIFLGILINFIHLLKASNNLHVKMLRSVIFSPMSFFDCTPPARILHRFSRDVQELDTILPLHALMALNAAIPIVLFAIGSAFVVLENWILVFILFLLVITLKHFFRKSSFHFKRVNANSLSLLLSHFSESVTGAAVIRSMNATDRFKQKTSELLDSNNSFDYLENTMSRWLVIRSGIINATVFFLYGMVIVLKSEYLSPSDVGYTLTCIINSMVAIPFACVSAVALDTSLISTERILEYCNLQNEESWKKDKKVVPPSWPDKGEISFRNYSARYRPGMDLVLKNICFTIKPSEKVGIVGRTGAGKSSIALALFRLIESANGEIVIDGWNIAELGLFDLRSRLTIIPQDPIMFSGSLRLNIDPLEQHSELEIWLALERAHLKPTIKNFKDGLNYEISEGGQNLSVGQRQLVCLARALLRNSQVLIMDEATASVDLDTDDLIQETVRREFRTSTVITIAHRLKTILDYDRVIVLDNGIIAEIDEPSNLLEDRDSMFFSLAKDAGLV